MTKILQNWTLAKNCSCLGYLGIAMSLTCVIGLIVSMSNNRDKFDEMIKREIGITTSEGFN